MAESGPKASATKRTAKAEPAATGAEGDGAGAGKARTTAPKRSAAPSADAAPGPVATTAPDGVAAPITAAAPDPAPAPGAPSAPPATKDGAVLLEAWAPLGRALDGRIGRAAWPSWASRLFADEQIPHIAHDSGVLSARHAAVIAAWLDTAEASGALPERVVLVEAGIGTGLHLRYLLRRLRAHAAANGAGWLPRLEVWATDVSRSLLHQVRARGLELAPDEAAGASAAPIAVHFGLLDVLRPGVVLPLDAAGVAGDERDLGGEICFWIANYVLDLMPADLFRRVRAPGGEVRWQVVLAQTWLAAPAELDRLSDLDVAAVVALVGEATPAAIAQLAPIWSLLEVEIRAFDLDGMALPTDGLHAKVADAIEAGIGRDHPALVDGTVVQHSGGALAVLERLQTALRPGGLALLRDLGVSSAEEAAVPRGAAHYGPTVATALSFFELDLALGGANGGHRWLRPAQDGPRAQASRLLGRAAGDSPQLAGALDAAAAAFVQALDGAGLVASEERAQAARNLSDPAAAIAAFRQALRAEPDNWFLLVEAGRVALDRGGNAQLAALLAREGLRINPDASADLWRLLGDAVWALGDRRTARAAYGEALRIRPRDARTAYGAAFVDAERGRFDAALEGIGRALAADPEGRLRADCLRLLDAALRGQVAAAQAEQQRVAQRSER